jgi:hypothetical protein
VTRLQLLLGLVLAVFSFETAWAIHRFGYVGTLREMLATFPGQLAALDLTIALSLVLAWMWRDARERGATFWPYALATLALGSVGPLAYLIRREGARRRAERPAAARVAQPV